MSERRDGPWYARLLNERGLGTLLAVVLVLAMLWFGVRIIDDMRSFQQQMIAESARTNEKLEQMQLAHIEMKLTLERLERTIFQQGVQP